MIGRLFGIIFGFMALMATTDVAQAQTYTFNSVNIEGNERIEAGTILSYAGIARGETVTAAQLNAAYQRILGSGLFQSVDLAPRGGTLVISVREWPTINRVSIEGNRRLDDDDLQPLLQSQSRRVFSPTVAEQDAAAIVEAYQQQGRLAATVDPVIIERSNNRVDLVFEVSEGRVVEIERLSFIGNRSYSDRRLRRILETKQAGILRSLIRADTFVADRLEFDKQVLRDFYLSRGYVDFQVLSATSEFSRDRNGFFVTFNIREGQSFDFGAVTVSSDLPEIDIAEYSAVVQLKPGDTYSPALVDATIARLERLAIKNGLDFVRADPRITRNDRALTLDIEFNLVRGERIFVERIDIEGNTTTLDRVIRQQFDTVEGDPFNPREIREAAERIRAMDFFEATEVRALDGSSPDQVVIDVDVEEKPTGSLSFGASYSVSSGVGFNIAFSERNFLGRGQALNFGINTTSGSQGANLLFVEPYFLGRDVAFSFAGAYTRSSYATNTFYDSQVVTVAPGLEFPIGETARLSVKAIYDGTEVTNVDPGSSQILRAEAARGFESAVGVGYQISFDNRTSGLNPDAGILFRFGQDIAGLTGSMDYIETKGLFVAERTMRNSDITFRAIFEGGAITALSGNGTKITDRYFLSSSQLRGFDVRGVGPRDLNSTNFDALGGNYFAVARFEADFPLPLPEEYGISGGAFLDFGSVWGLDNTAGGLTGTNPVDDNAYLRASIGVSVFWDTPVGPLRFNFSQPLAKQVYDDVRNFDLTVSTSF
ncbi:MAG: outer membrane protein assembly factor BamA [Paracoccaceae bacterium]